MDWFRARLEMGLGRAAFMNKRWEQAQGFFAAVAEKYPETTVAAEAIYYRGVCQYKATNDHIVLGEVAKELAEKFPNDEWTLKSLPWGH